MVLMVVREVVVEVLRLVVLVEQAVKEIMEVQEAQRLEQEAEVPVRLVVMVQEMVETVLQIQYQVRQSLMQEAEEEDKPRVILLEELGVEELEGQMFLQLLVYLVQQIQEAEVGEQEIL